ncbi:hypothetical protein B0H11DRAFT_1701058, partial [Mycena galericulata]
YPCTLDHWFSAVRGEHPCPETGMWIVTPDTVRGGRGPSLAVVHLDCFTSWCSLDLHNFGFTDSLDAFKAFYVNKYADPHAHEIAF